MIRHTTLLLFFVAILSCDQTAKNEKLQNDGRDQSAQGMVDEKTEALEAARKVASGFVDGDWDVVLTSMDRRYYEQLGISEEDMDAELANVKKQFEEAGLNFLKCEPIEPDEIHQLEPYTIAFVATENEMTVGGTTVAGTGLLIAAKYKGESTWRFLDGSTMNRDEILDFYPELPRDCEIPAVKIELRK